MPRLVVHADQSIWQWVASACFALLVLLILPSVAPDGEVAGGPMALAAPAGVASGLLAGWLLRGRVPDVLLMAWFQVPSAIGAVLLYRARDKPGFPHAAVALFVLAAGLSLGAEIARRLNHAKLQTGAQAGRAPDHPGIAPDERLTWRQARQVAFGFALVLGVVLIGAFAAAKQGGPGQSMTTVEWGVDEWNRLADDEIHGSAPWSPMTAATQGASWSGEPFELPAHTTHFNVSFEAASAYLDGETLLSVELETPQGWTSLYTLSPGTKANSDGDALDGARVRFVVTARQNAGDLAFTIRWEAFENVTTCTQTYVDGQATVPDCPSYGI